MTNPYPPLHWRPAAPRNEVLSLVDDRGFQWQTLQQFSLGARVQDVEHELLSQIRMARDAGLRISHFQSYHGALFTRTDLASVYLHVSRTYWIPAITVELTDEHITRFRDMGFPLDNGMIHLISNYPLPKLDELLTMPSGETYEEKAAEFAKLIANLKPGLTQIMSYPAVHSVGLESTLPGWQ